MLHHITTRIRSYFCWQKRREAQAASGILDEAAQELLEANMEERVKLEAEIEEMRKKSVSHRNNNI